MSESLSRQSGGEGCLWVVDAKKKGYHHPERVRCAPGMSVACVNCGGPTAPITDDIPFMGGINEPKLAAEGWRVVRQPRTGVALRKERIDGR
jgi:hypothetical protein